MRSEQHSLLPKRFFNGPANPTSRLVQTEDLGDGACRIERIDRDGEFFAGRNSGTAKHPRNLNFCHGIAAVPFAASAMIGTDQNHRRRQHCGFPQPRH